jgi:CDP-diacylglycerol---glycerol-3-phosphate 3-phosphatidyltransferase
MGIYRIKPWFQRVLQPITDAFIRNRISPDVLTYGAILTALLMGFGIVAVSGGASRWWLIVVAAAAPVRLAFNALDGQVARGLGVAGPIGEVKNEIGDRLADVLIVGSLCLVPQVPRIVSAGALAMTLLIPYIGVLSKAITGVREYGGGMAKPDRMAVIAAGCVLVALTGEWRLFTGALSVLIALGLITFYRRLEAIRERS